MSEEEICKLIKCAAMVSGQAGSIPSLLQSTTVLNGDKGRELTKLLTEFGERYDLILS